MNQPLAPDTIASVVSYLECRPIPASNTGIMSREDVRLQRQAGMDCSAYRDMFLDVGQDWFWFSRLQISDQALNEILHDPKTDLRTLHNGDGGIIGFLELDYSALPRVQISFLGVTPDVIGRGLGSYLMTHAFRLAREQSGDHLRVQTCTLDHPSALAFYRKMGFEIYARDIEITRDPRLDGILPRTAAPHMPLLKQ